MKEGKGNEGNGNGDDAKEKGATHFSVFFFSGKETEEP